MLREQQQTMSMRSVFDNRNTFCLWIHHVHTSTDSAQLVRAPACQSGWTWMSRRMLGQRVLQKSTPFWLHFCTVTPNFVRSCFKWHSAFFHLSLRLPPHGFRLCTYVPMRTIYLLTSFSLPWSPQQHLAHWNHYEALHDITVTVTLLRPLSAIQTSPPYQQLTYVSAFRFIFFETKKFMFCDTNKLH
jgi:hypothetical protein